VELGKALASRCADDLIADEGPVANEHDASTTALIRRYRAMRRRP